MMTSQPQTVLKDWVDNHLQPWKDEVAAYQQAYARHQATLKAALPQLETLVGLLLDGRTRAAVLAWNTLGLPPQVKDIHISPDGRTLTLLPSGGAPIVLQTDVLLAELDRLA